MFKVRSIGVWVNNPQICRVSFLSIGILWNPSLDLRCHHQLKEPFLSFNLICLSMGTWYLMRFSCKRYKWILIHTRRKHDCMTQSTHESSSGILKIFSCAQSSKHHRWARFFLSFICMQKCRKIIWSKLKYSKNKSTDTFSKLNTSSPLNYSCDKCHKMKQST